MNEVARCAQIVLGIAAASTGSGGPVALVDLGTGAGLGLQLDRYRCRIGTGTYGPAGAGLTLACEVRGPVAPPPAGLPPVATRIGVDLDPVDLADPAARAWLVACAPPEASALSRLAAAVDIARRHPATIIAGDLVNVLPAYWPASPCSSASLSPTHTPWCSSRGSGAPSRLGAARPLSDLRSGQPASDRIAV